MRKAWVLALWCAGCVGDATGIASPKDDTDPADTDLGDVAADETAETAVTFDTMPADTSDADTDLPDCVLRLDVARTGADLTDFPIQVDLDPWTGVEPDFANVVPKLPDGTLLDHWIQKVDGTTGQGTVWFVIPTLGSGRTRVWLDACDASVEDLGDPNDIFLMLEPFDDPTTPDWTLDCDRMDQASETCVSEHRDVMGDGLVRLEAKSSCYGPPYSGAEAYAERTLTVPAGRWRVQTRIKHAGAMHGYCSGGTSAYTHVIVDGIDLGGVTCSYSGCVSCDEDAATHQTELFDGGKDVVLRLRGRANDCAEMAGFVDDVAVWQASDPMPVVTIAGP